MKHLTIITFISVLLTSCGGGQEVSTDLVGQTGTFKFEETEYNFGEIIQGQIVNHTYVFTNEGPGDLVITDAQGSCGCTVPTYPKKPIKKGEKGEIEVVFNSSGKQGEQNKTVTITANTKPTETVIYIKGNVVLPKQ
jgi:hypothetical protein